MKCPICEKEMLRGRINNITMHHMMLDFHEEGESRKLFDMFRKDSIAANILAGSEQEGFYCDDCKKLVLVADVL